MGAIKRFTALSTTAKRKVTQTILNSMKIPNQSPIKQCESIQKVGWRLSSEGAIVP